MTFDEMASELQTDDPNGVYVWDSYVGEFCPDWDIYSDKDKASARLGWAAATRAHHALLQTPEGPTFDAIHSAIMAEKFAPLTGPEATTFLDESPALCRRCGESGAEHTAPRTGTPLCHGCKLAAEARG